jgi:hypothetical protein
MKPEIVTFLRDSEKRGLIRSREEYATSHGLVAQAIRINGVEENDPEIKASIGLRYSPIDAGQRLYCVDVIREATGCRVVTFIEDLETGDRAILGNLDRKALVKAAIEATHNKFGMGPLLRHQLPGAGKIALDWFESFNINVG